MTEVSDTELPPSAGKIPKRDILIEIFDRVTLLSDEINDPDGLLAVRLAQVEMRAVARHEELKRFMNTVLDEILDVRSRVDVLEDAQPNRITVQ